MAKPHGGPTSSLGGVERLIPTSNNRKKNIGIDNLLNPTERYPQTPLLENPPESETEPQKTSRLERNIREQKRYDDKEMASIKSQTKKFNGMRFEEPDKKLRSILYLALGNEEKKIFGQKFTRVKILQISFKEIWENLSIAFVRKTNVTFERPNLLDRKQKERENRWNNFGEPSQKWLRDVIYPQEKTNGSATFL